MLNRNEDGKLVLSAFDLTILISELYEKCNTKEEIEWLQNELSSRVECEAENRDEEIQEAS